MKLAIFLACNLFLFISFSGCFAQKRNVKISGMRTPELEERIRKSDLIVEGMVTNTKGFQNNGTIYTSAIVKISKVFKGIVSDSLIEIALEGGADGDVAASVAGGISLAKNYDGIFLLTNNKTSNRLVSGFESYLPYWGLLSYIEYAHGPMLVAHHVAVCQNSTYDDLEKDLYQRIEAETHQPRKVLRPNAFESEAAQKK